MIVQGTARIDGTAAAIGASSAIAFTMSAAFLAHCRTTDNCFIRFESTNAAPFDGGSRYLSTLLWVTTPEPVVVGPLAVGLAVVGCARRRRC